MTKKTSINDQIGFPDAVYILGIFPEEFPEIANPGIVLENLEHLRVMPVFLPGMFIFFRLGRRKSRINTGRTRSSHTAFQKFILDHYAYIVVLRSINGDSSSLWKRAQFDHLSSWNRSTDLVQICVLDDIVNVNDYCKFG
jgi:hypothetical protein